MGKRGGCGCVMCRRYGGEGCENKSSGCIVPFVVIISGLAGMIYLGTHFV